MATEREKIRAREREKLNAGSKSLRYEPKAYMKRVVDRFNLKSWLGTDKAKEQMLMAGYRGAQAEIGFLFFRLVLAGGPFCSSARSTSSSSRISSGP